MVPSDPAQKCCWVLLYCTFGKGKVSRLRHGQQCRKGNFLTWSELILIYLNHMISYIGRHLGLSPEMDTWYIDILIYIYSICLGRLMVTWKTNIQLWPPCRKPIHQVGVLRPLLFEILAPGMILAYWKPLKVDKILKYHVANGGCVWVSCGFQLWTCFFFESQIHLHEVNPSMFVSRDRNNICLISPQLARSPGTIEKATWS